MQRKYDNKNKQRFNGILRKNGKDVDFTLYKKTIHNFVQTFNLLVLKHVTKTYMATLLQLKTFCSDIQICQTV
jgi:hypothetical protein